MKSFSFKNGDTLHFGELQIKIVDMTITVNPATPGLPRVMVDLLRSVDAGRVESQTLELSELVIELRQKYAMERVTDG